MQCGAVAKLPVTSDLRTVPSGARTRRRERAQAGAMLQSPAVHRRGEGGGGGGVTGGGGGGGGDGKWGI